MLILCVTLVWQDIALFAGGAATAFVAHEAGHATANFAMGNTPHLERVTFAGFVPFFAVAPDIYCSGDTCSKRDGSVFGPGRRGLLVILTAGFNVQHVTDEVLLSTDPRTPFREGLLAFNTLTSIGYAAANIVGLEPPAGDLTGAYRDARAPRAFTNALLLSIAGADIARFVLPEQRWIGWVSRGLKIVFLGLPVAI